MKNSITILILSLLISLQSFSQTQQQDTVVLRSLVEKYCRSVNIEDSLQAASLWEHNHMISFINPRGHEIGWENISNNIYKFFWTYFSKRNLRSVKERYSIYDNMAIVEFYWVFNAILKSDNSTLQTKGRETQIWRKGQNGWKLVHVHYSGMPVMGEP